MTQHKCFGCFYKTDWEDETHEFPICEREWWSYEEAKAECEKPGPCERRITREEALKMLEQTIDYMEV